MVVFANNSNGNRTPQISPRRFLVKGNWSLSWRNSKRSLIAKDTDEKGETRPSENTRICKRVHFDDEQMATEIPQSEDPITTEELAECWYQEKDYSKFEKDRVFTSLGYMARQRIGGITFDDSGYCTRGIENMCDAKLGRRQIGEKKDLYRAMKGEERRQKAEGTFPDLEAFRSVSIRYSKAGSERAVTMGQQDAWAYRPKPKNPMVEALTRGFLWRKNFIINPSPRPVLDSSCFEPCDRKERRKSIG